MRPNEVESKKGIYYDHQAPPGSLFCTDKNGDQENRIFKKIYNGELPLYKPLYKFTGAVQIPGIYRVLSLKICSKTSVKKKLNKLKLAVV